jgi:cell division protein FtsW
MNRKLPYDQSLILIVLALLGFGLVIVFSASSVISKELYGPSTAIFFRQLSSVLIGLLLFFVAMRTDYHILGRKPVLYGLLGISAVLLVWALFSPGINGVHRWILLGPFRFQPSEAAKFTAIILTAYFLASKGGQVKEIDRSMLNYLAVLLALIVTVLLAPDFGTSTSLAATAALMLFLAGLRLRYYIAMALLACPLFYFLIYLVPYRRQRILAFLDPSADPQGSGYQIIQSLVAVGSGGLTGKGLAQGTQKLFFLPEAHTDFIYAVVGEELGLLGCTLILLLFVLLLWRGIHVSLRADTVFGTFLGLGIVMMIVFQALFNISVVLSIVPTKGIPLPFISVGGSSVLVMLVSVGVLLNISRHTRGAVGPSAGIATAGWPGMAAQSGSNRNDRSA